MKKKSEPDESAVAPDLSISIPLQQLRSGINNHQDDDTERLFYTAKSCSDKLTPEDQARLIQHLEQNLDNQFTPAQGMRNPYYMKGLEKYHALRAWYFGRCLTRYISSVCEDVRHQEGIEIDDLSMVTDRQALTFALLLGSYGKKGVLTDKEVQKILSFIYELLPIFWYAHDGNQFAQKQLRAIQKLIFAERYGFQESDIEKILERKHTFSAPLARGLEINKLRAEISWLVERRDGSGLIAANNDPVKPADTFFVSLKKDLAKKIKNHLCQLSNPTLDDLTISIYNESIEDGSGNSKDPGKLKEDLRAYEKWRDQSPGLNTPGSRYFCELPTEEYTEGWRKRKPGSGGKRQILKGRKSKDQKL